MPHDVDPRGGLEVRLPQPRRLTGITRFTGPLTEIVQALVEIDAAHLLRPSDTTWFVADLRHVEGDLIARLEDPHPDRAVSIDDALVPVRALLDGLIHLRQWPAVPRLFMPSTVRRVARLASPQHGLRRVGAVGSAGSWPAPVELCEAIRVNADAAARRKTMINGAVVGVLSGAYEIVAGSMLKTRLRDLVDGELVEGFVPQRLAEQLRDAWQHPVVMTGAISRNAVGQAIRIDAHSVEVLLDQYSIPADVGAATAGLTGVGGRR
jgi:hypothetical protein